MQIADGYLSSGSPPVFTYLNVQGSCAVVELLSYLAHYPNLPLLTPLLRYVQLEFEAVMVLNEILVITITVITLVMHLVGNVITLKTKKLRMHCSRLCQHIFGLYSVHGSMIHEVISKACAYV